MKDLSSLTYHLERPVYEYHQYQGESNDCGPISLAIAANAWLGENRFSGQVVARELNKPVFELLPVPRLVIRRIPEWATFPWGIVHYLREQAIPARWGAWGTINMLKNVLKKDLIPLVFVGQPLRWTEGKYHGWSHVKVLYAYTPGMGFLFVDPARRKPDHSDSWEGQGLWLQEEEEFLTRWKRVAGLFVVVGRSSSA